ncbi:hypothetical protein AQUSIP_06980 [Aquicella siphonis]|uniref:Lipoprotein n=1 Tax=Aquicella siphonis TaxID=254247 RepID=A0A5E4PFX3_9COXI|nr:hypothetical protein [Aquicella siphonis]VVC75408.1 hypothetical protein AQUSIP_06980 [Aquicella siphonis]
MKVRRFVSLSCLLITACVYGCAFAGKEEMVSKRDKIFLPNGEGFISLPTEGENPSKSISLDTLNPGFTYNVICKVVLDIGNKYPITFRFDVNNKNDGRTFSGVRFDGVKLKSKQMKIKDDKNHTVIFDGIQTAGNGAAVVISMVPGTKTINPLDYNCYATYSIGLV